MFLNYVMMTWFVCLVRKQNNLAFILVVLRNLFNKGYIKVDLPISFMQKEKTVFIIPLNFSRGPPKTV